MTGEAFPDGLAEVIEKAQPLVDRFREAGHRIFFVGGVVRDNLLNRSRDEHDLDATTTALPAEIKALVSGLADAVWTQGERFGTIGCRIGGEIYEITTHRADAYDDDSRKPIVSFGDCIEDDLARRDFTVNAMAVDLESGVLVDPHGGRDDLAAGVLRTPLDPHISFSEDPLRMLRAARFHAAYSLTPVPELTAALSSMVERISIVSAERIRDELQKLILLDAPAAGLRLLAETGLLGVIVPKLGLLDGRAAEALGERIAAVESEPSRRWAALFVDVGVAPADLTALKFSGALTRDVVWLSTAREWVQSPGSVPNAAPAMRRAAAMAPGNRRVEEQLAWIRELRIDAGLPVDDVASAELRLRSLRLVEPDLADPAPLLTGEAVCAVLGIEPGRDVGVAMKWLRDIRVEEGPVPAEDAAERLVMWWPTRAQTS